MDTEYQLMQLRGVSLDMDGTTVLRNQDFVIQAGHCYIICGPMDTANVFLLQTIAGILPYHDRTGQILFKGLDVYNTRERELKEIKRQTAFIFREGTLISNLTIEENLLLPIQYHQPDLDTQSVLEKIKEGFDYFRIPDILNLRPADLSYSVKKKLSFIRASLREPELIFLDKPMFNLSEQDRDQVLDYLEDLKSKGVTLVMVSQFQSLLKELPDITIHLKNGIIEEIKGVGHEV